MPKIDGRGPSNGVTEGGEPAREALVGRAGALLKASLNLDIDVPETHVLAMEPGFFPPDAVGRMQGANGTIPNR